MRRHWPKQGETQIYSGFLFFPKTIDGETRWLEHASWQEEVVYREIDGRRVDWILEPVTWIDDPLPCDICGCVPEPKKSWLGWQMSCLHHFSLGGSKYKVIREWNKEIPSP